MAEISSKAVKLKLALLQLADALGSVSKACKLLGVSRDSYYRFKQLYESGGAEALADLPRSRPNLKNRIAIDIENQILRLTYMQPLWGAVSMARELRRRGVTISPAGVRCVWVRHDLETIAKRLKRLQSEEQSQPTRESSSLKKGGESENSDCAENLAKNSNDWSHV